MSEQAPLDQKLLAAVDRLGRALRTARQQVATELELSVLQLQVLETVADGGPRRIGRLAAELSVSQPTLSDAVATLEAKDLVRRSPDPGDARATTAVLTAAGRTVARRASARLASLRHTEASTPGDQAVALDVLLAEIARLHDAGLITVDRSCRTCDHFRVAAGDRPAHCRLLDQPLRRADLRVDCPEHSSLDA